jgi:hypothetical protein
MTKKKDTNLKLSAVKSQAKKAHLQEKYELEDGSTISFFPIFPELEIESMLEELQRHMITLKEKDITLSDKMNMYLISLMTIKYFTHFKNDMPDHLFTEGKEAGLLDWLNHFADTGLMKTIMEEVFLKNQVAKIYDKLTEFLGATMLLEELSDKTQQHFQNMKIKHSDAFDKVEGFNVKADVVQ